MLPKTLGLIVLRTYFTFPTCLKHYFVTPILKDDSPSDVKNYRLESILNTLSLIFEKYIFFYILYYIIYIILCILSYLIQVNLVFFLYRSTGLNLASSLHFVSDALNKGTQVKVVNMVYQKSLILVVKLLQLRFHESCVTWFKILWHNVVLIQCLLDLCTLHQSWCHKWPFQGRFFLTLIEKYYLNTIMVILFTNRHEFYF